MSSSHYRTQNHVREHFDTMSDLAGTYGGHAAGRDNFGYSPEYRKNANDWWKTASEDHPGIQAHRNAHKRAMWVGGRFMAPNTSQCTSNEQCFAEGMNCDSGLAFATQCIAYEPWRVACSSGHCIIDG